MEVPSASRDDYLRGRDVTRSGSRPWGRPSHHPKRPLLSVRVSAAVTIRGTLPVSDRVLSHEVRRLSFPHLRPFLGDRDSGPSRDAHDLYLPPSPVESPPVLRPEHRNLRVPNARPLPPHHTQTPSRVYPPLPPHPVPGHSRSHL